MALNLTQKIIKNHLASGEMVPGKQVAIKIDQTLTQDATGTMSYLQFEALGLDRVQTELSVSYVDHNMLQTGFENADDHRYLQTVAARYGIVFSRPGNGICHQVHLERFGRPGKTLLGSDSHTPTNGGLAMLAIGAGGLDVSLAMGGEPFYTTMPKIVLVKLTGKLQPFVSAKDVILELLRRLTVKGGVGRIFEYGGEGVKGLSVPERSTITNMGAELGATTSLFPSDDQTRKYLKAQGREKDYVPMEADPGATYDETVEIDLNTLEPLIAQPHSPDNVVKVREIQGIPVSQVAIGSCTNSSYKDLLSIAGIMKGKTVHPSVSLGFSPGSRQTLEMISQNGVLGDLIAAGARLLESACGPCIGMGFAPPSGGVSVRTFNRNFEGRSGTKDAKVYLASPEVAAACAITGVITDPRDLKVKAENVELPEKYVLDDRMVIFPPADGHSIEVLRGPNIKPLPTRDRISETVSGTVLLKVGDNITTDHIMPAGAKVLPLRSNVPAISQYVFESVDPTFPKRAKEAGGGFIVGGANYGQGSSREHAALAPMYLGVRAVIVKGFARIHLANLINFGILPLTFANESDYDKIDRDDKLEFSTKGLETGRLVLRNLTKKIDIPVTHSLSARDLEIVRAGGTLAYVKEQAKK